MDHYSDFSAYTSSPPRWIAYKVPSVTLLARCEADVVRSPRLRRDAVPRCDAAAAAAVPAFVLDRPQMAGAGAGGKAAWARASGCLGTVPMRRGVYVPIPRSASAFASTSFSHFDNYPSHESLRLFSDFSPEKDDQHAFSTRLAYYTVPASNPSAPQTPKSSLRGGGAPNQLDPRRRSDRGGEILVQGPFNRSTVPSESQPPSASQSSPRAECGPKALEVVVEQRAPLGGAAASSPAPVANGPAILCHGDAPCKGQCPQASREAQRGVRPARPSLVPGMPIHSPPAFACCRRSETQGGRLPACCMSRAKAPPESGAPQVRGEPAPPPPLPPPPAEVAKEKQRTTSLPLSFQPRTKRSSVAEQARVLPEAERVPNSRPPGVPVGVWGAPCPARTRLSPLPAQAARSVPGPFLPPGACRGVPWVRVPCAPPTAQGAGGRSVRPQSTPSARGARAMTPTTPSQGSQRVRPAPPPPPPSPPLQPCPRSSTGSRGRPPGARTGAPPVPARGPASASEDSTQHEWADTYTNYYVKYCENYEAQTGKARDNFYSAPVSTPRLSATAAAGPAGYRRPGSSCSYSCCPDCSCGSGTQSYSERRPMTAPPNQGNFGVAPYESTPRYSGIPPPASPGLSPHTSQRAVPTPSPGTVLFSVNVKQRPRGPSADVSSTRAPSGVDPNQRRQVEVRALPWDKASGERQIAGGQEEAVAKRSTGVQEAVAGRAQNSTPSGPAPAPAPVASAGRTRASCRCAPPSAPTTAQSASTPTPTPASAPCCCASRVAAKKSAEAQERVIAVVTPQSSSKMIASPSATAAAETQESREAYKQPPEMQAAASEAEVAVVTADASAEVLPPPPPLPPSAPPATPARRTFRSAGVMMFDVVIRPTDHPSV